MKKCKQGYYYCYTDEKCKPIPQGLKMTARFSGGGREPEETGIDAPTNGNNQNGNGNGNGNSNGGSNGGGVSEGTLHKWFKGSKSKDGKGGWVNVVTGGTCASDEPGEGTPKCVSSAKRASMSKAERLSAQRRKKKADPGQQQKSGAAKPTYVSTDKKKMKKEEKVFNEFVGTALAGTKGAIDAKPKDRVRKAIGSGAGYAVGAKGGEMAGKEVGKAVGGAVGQAAGKAALPIPGVNMATGFVGKEVGKVVGSTIGKVAGGVAGGVAGSAVGNKLAGETKEKKKEVKEERSYSDFMKECWKTHKKVGMKMKGGKMVPDCRPKTASDYKEEVEVQSEGAAWTKKSGKSESGGLNEKGRKSYERENPGSDLKAPSKKVGNPRRASFCARMKGMKKKLTSKKTANDPDSRINKSLRAWNC